MLPGTRLDDPAPIAAAIQAKLNPGGRPWFEVRKTWRPVVPSSDELEAFLVDGQYYVLYTHPVHRFKDKLFLANRREVLDFLKQRFVPERGEGTDVTVAAVDLGRIVVGNHDGDLFLTGID
jgi:hypothetical protein